MRASQATSRLGASRGWPGEKVGMDGQAEARTPSHDSSLTRWASRSSQVATVTSSSATSGRNGAVPLPPSASSRH